MHLIEGAKSESPHIQNFLGEGREIPFPIVASTVQTTDYRKCTVKLQTVLCSQGQSCNGCAKNLPHSLPLLSLLSITVKYSPKGGGVDERRNGRLFFPPNLSIMFFRTSFRARAQSSVCTCESHTGSAGCFRFPFSGIVHSVPACCVRNSSIFIENAAAMCSRLTNEARKYGYSTKRKVHYFFVLHTYCLKQSTLHLRRQTSSNIRELYSPGRGTGAAATSCKSWKNWN